MNIDDKATESPDVRLMYDAQHSGYRLLSTELVPADEITDEDEFPEFGDFLSVALPGSGDESQLYVECPQSLAAGLVGLEVEDGDEFRVEAASKVDGEWQVEVTAGAKKS